VAAYERQRAEEQQPVRDAGPAPLPQARGEHAARDESAPVDPGEHAGPIDARTGECLAVRNAIPVRAQAPEEAGERRDQEQAEEEIAGGGYFRHRVLA